MTDIQLQPTQKQLQGTMSVPGDKSISHRSVIFSGLAEGTSHITNFLTGEDCLRTVEAFREMGVRIDQQDDRLTVYGRGIQGLKEPSSPLNFGNSGTTARLMSGILAGLPLFTTAFGDASLSKRPMDRVVVPLKQMGADITGRDENRLLPLAFRGRKLEGTVHELTVRSAQVKSALLLAGMLADGETKVVELGQTRNHTEMLLPEFGVNLNVEGAAITIEGGQQPQASDIKIPGDISSAAFFIVAASIVPGSDLIIKDVGLNATRDGIIQAMKKMGADIETDIHTYIGREPVGDVRVRSSRLKALQLDGELIPNLIDEIPIIALAATQAEGTTVIKDAEELKFKETDRIEAVVTTLTKLGAEVEATEDGMVIHGGASLTGGSVHSYGDHRIGMMGAVASLISAEPVTIQDKDCINISYPSFFEHLNEVLR
ncbi:3-phosphoshikimate 1-carboxyvinyltransferase [Halobacillus kuroshimensis]|uniref:3-phosphoshikimate 1-carboxyvinyltransferase n=1 Tax=Halobacillus kuroshimensis TaxID=302481 RepID=A0ABS3DTJ3_9BACI|nr:MULTISPECIES: 3-phosphoshikimate 1-carboxyvinyltransferase [Halobacillus]MBN8234673.1 3-phosphoshikimate 1-carboxyvinyltransferase [Halobacillus kuroshimensis]